MRFFDLHCDTIGECCKKGYSLNENNLNVSISKAKHLDEYVQVFAIWIPDELRKQNAVNYFNDVYNYYEAEIEKNKDFITPLKKCAETESRFKSILAVEGGAALGGTIDGLYNLYNKNVRILTLTWNAENEIASGAFCDDGGLTNFGKNVVKECEKLGIVIDVSHLNRQSFFDVAQHTTKPFIASHSNPDIVNTFKGKHRNLTDEQLEIINKRKGLIGLNFYDEFLDVDGKSGVDALAIHINYLLERVNENVIAIGSDFDGCRISQGLGNLQNIENVYNELMKKGFNETLLNKIFFDNANDFFKTV